MKYHYQKMCSNRHKGPFTYYVIHLGGGEGVLEKMTKDYGGGGVFELDDVILKIEILEEKLSNF